MKEAFFILVVFLVIAVLTAIRYRKQIAGMMHIWRSLQAMRGQTKESQPKMPEDRGAAGPLVNCIKCGTWVPEQRAIKLGTRSFYCSPECLERSASPD